mmetsp:Transcript_51986/g.118624  ORF Transcript_51986/g.118624 Transcript_51986/m.118624 type:complete len:237 (-) Transcript_51986:582-1292(-)
MRRSASVLYCSNELCTNSLCSCSCCWEAVSKAIKSWYTTPLNFSDPLSRRRSPKSLTSSGRIRSMSSAIKPKRVSCLSSLKTKDTGRNSRSTQPAEPCSSGMRLVPRRKVRTKSVTLLLSRLSEVLIAPSASQTPCRLPPDPVTRIDRQPSAIISTLPPLPASNEPVDSFRAPLIERLDLHSPASTSTCAALASPSTCIDPSTLASPSTSNAPLTCTCPWETRCSESILAVSNLRV